MRSHNTRHSLIVRTAAASALLTLAAHIPSASAQDASTYYTVQHPEQFKIDWGAFYRQADAKTAAVRAQLPHYLNLAYGQDVKQRLDLYLPTKKPAHAPVFLFLHGGGFREGDRAQYGFVAKPFADHGVITAVASYRLTGDGFKYPDQPHDTQLAVEWLYRNIAKYGGDPDRLYVGGHSAGAILSAEIGVDRGWLKSAGIPTRVLRGIAPISGPYDLRTAGRPGEDSAYAPTPELKEQASPLLHIVDPAPAAVIALGSAENLGSAKQSDMVMDSSKAFAAKLQAAGVKTQLLILDGKDHRGTVTALGDEDSELFKAVIQMITAPPEAAAR
jgi:acetyl esterase/lipase